MLLVRAFVASTVLVVCASSAVAVEPPGFGDKVHPTVWQKIDGKMVIEGEPAIKVWVFFTPGDKGHEGPSAREAALASLEQSYNAKAISRRAHRRTRPGLFDEADLPVPTAHVNQVHATGAAVKVTSRWLNAVSAVATREQINSIAVLPFVSKIQPVRSTGTIRPVNFDPAHEAAQDSNGSPTAGAGSFYGESQEQLAQINLTALHDLGFTGDGVVVGVLDTGFKRTHAAFNEPGHPVNVLAEYDFVNDDPDTSSELGDPETQHSHGTYILGVIGAYQPNVLVGGAYDASFVLCKTEDTTDEYQGEEDFYVAGLEFIESNGGDMATSSLGYIDWYTQESLNGMIAVTTQAVNIATGNGLYCVTAAGNGGHDADPATSALIAPADAPLVLTCGAVESTGEIAGFSSDGPTADDRVKPEVLARGVDTRTVASLDDLATTGVNGTSLSTPLVAAAVACLIEAHPEWTVEQMRTFLMSTASDYVNTGAYDPLYVYGYGVIDALAALDQDCDGNAVVDSIDIGMGTHADCNSNGIPDVCDTTFGHARDINGNDVPDICEGIIPTVSQWGLVVMLITLLAVATLIYLPKRTNPARSCGTVG
ncbi:MAG: S8 family serine peptidase [Planctomycetota bacterium]